MHSLFETVVAVVDISLNGYQLHSLVPWNAVINCVEEVQRQKRNCLFGGCYFRSSIFSFEKIAKSSLDVISIRWIRNMVQLKVNSVSSFNERKTIKKRWGPSLSDCLEIHATIKNGVANKGTWKLVSSIIIHQITFRLRMPTKKPREEKNRGDFYSQKRNKKKTIRRLERCQSSSLRC